MKAIPIIKRSFSHLPFLLAATLSACGNPNSEPPLDTRIAAALDTAVLNAECQQITPFYVEIGDAAGPLLSASIGGTAYAPTTPMNIASATKWLFGAYVAEVRGGVLSAADVRATHMLSGYVSMGHVCTSSMTVESCFTFGANDTYTSTSLDRFHYNSGHFQKWGVDNGLAAMTGTEVAHEFRRVLGSDIPITFNGPLLAGGAIMSAEGYAVFLRKILNGQLRIAGLLGASKTCTLPGACATADESPVPAAWSYSVGHWVEDDAAADGAFSSAGAFGFYPWIDRTKTHYGVLARFHTGSGGGWESAECGSRIRNAFTTGIVQ